MKPLPTRHHPIGFGRCLILMALACAPAVLAGPAWADSSSNSPSTSVVPPSGSTGATSTTTTVVGAPPTGSDSTTSTTATGAPPLAPGSADTTTTSSLPAVPAPRTATTIVGSGSSFAGPEVLQWTADTARSPYNLTVDYTSTSSGDGRFNFGNGTVDFAVSDIPYQAKAFDTAQPNFPFIYVPVTAGGLAFMYHLSGLSKTLQLSSYSACAIMTGGVKMWNDPVIAADNPGVSLPAVPITPVIRSDLAGTNFVLQEYCIHEQPAMWKAFVTSPAVTSDPQQVGDLSATEPRSDWPIFVSGVLASGSAAAADDVAVPNDNGYITAVETAYALQRNLPVASVKNASGDYTQPTAVGVDSALAYATQQANGTHTLNFDGTGPNVYNPSTYSYLLTPTTGWNAAKGTTLSQFAYYSLTLGQQKAPEIGYASLGLSLEQYGVNAIKSQVPGAGALTAQEQNAYACGDLTVPEVQAGQTQPTCGVVNTNNSATPGQAGGGGTSRTTSGTGTTAVSSSSKAAKTKSGSGAGASSTANGGGAGGAGSIDPGVAPITGGALPTTGGAPLPAVALGMALATIGWYVRRRLRARIDANP